MERCAARLQHISLGQRYTGEAFGEDNKEEGAVDKERVVEQSTAPEQQVKKSASQKRRERKKKAEDKQGAD
jgi:hypothetical protein